jgi:hypothetical protein
MTLWLLSLLAVAILAVWFVRRRRFVVPCSVELEATHDHFHAHVILDGFQVEPGDAVQLTEAPTAIPFGEIRAIRSQAEVRQASWLRRQWTRLVGRFELDELYDVGFE